MLKDKQIKSLNEPGRYGDARGLYLRVWPTGRKYFYLAVQVRGKRYDVAVGEYPVTSLADARERADATRAALKAGKSLEPSLSDNTVANSDIKTFGVFAFEVVDQIESGFRNVKHRAQWRSTLQTYCQPIWKKPVADVNVSDVVKILQPIWTTKAETASRVRGRMERVFDAAIALDLRTAANPAEWKGKLRSLLPERIRLQRGHHAALPYQKMGEFWERLGRLTSISSEALRFLILTAARSGEVRGMNWAEIEGSVWTVPAIRMKAGREHRVPLSDEAMDILSRANKLTGGTGLIFPGGKQGKPLSDWALGELLKTGARGYTVHGFRSTFRDWAAEETDHPREIAEAALAHVVGDATERAYRRGDALTKRRMLMDDWARFINQGS